MFSIKPRSWNVLDLYLWGGYSSTFLSLHKTTSTRHQVWTVHLQSQVKVIYKKYRSL